MIESAAKMSCGLVSLLLVCSAGVSYVRAAPSQPIPPFSGTHPVWGGPLPPHVGWLPPSSPPLPPSATSTTTTTAAPKDNAKIIESFHVKSDIRYRFATTQISSVARNLDAEARELTFDVILPKEAFIVSFFMEIEGKVYDGEVKEKTKAKQEYQQAVDRGQSAGHIRQAPRHSNIFEVSVNVANGTAVNFTLTYQEILQRKLGLYDHEIHINPGQPVKDFLIEVYIQENKAINFVRTPALRKDALITNEVEADNQLTVIDRPSPQSAHILYRPPLAEQGKDGLMARFAVQYDVDHSPAGEVLVADGYFVHFFAPDLPAMPKDIIFVLDVSGSMHGNKLQQVKDAMGIILNDLQEDDRFNLVTFSSHVSKWGPTLMPTSNITTQEVKKVVDIMVANGMTDINSALLTAISELRGRENTIGVPMIFFLTDGEPTEGITAPKEIANNVFRSNEGTVPIISLAFGEGANYDLLKTISAQNSGFAKKIYEASDATLQVTTLYNEISAVAMKDISVKYLNSGVDEYTLTENDFPVIFNGSEIMICGVFAPQADTFELEITGLQKSGEVDLVLEVDNVDNIILTDDNLLNPLFTMPRDYAGIVERMWAYKTIKQLLREKMKLDSDGNEVKELEDKILQMSLKYKFVTPLTSMVVTKPDQEDGPEVSEFRDADDVAPQHPQPLSSGMAGLPGMAWQPSGTSLNIVAPGRQMIYHRPVHTMPWATMPWATMPWATMPRWPTTATATTTTTTTTAATTTTTTATSVPTMIFKDKRIMTLTYHDPNTTMCLVPKNIKAGKYQLLVADGWMVELETVCAKNCRQVLVKDVKILPTHQATSALSMIHHGQPQPLHTARGPHRQMDMTISVSGIKVTVGHFWRNRSNLISIDVTVDEPSAISGLMGELLTKGDNFQNKKQPKPCRRFNPDISLFVYNKRAQKYSSLV